MPQQNLDLLEVSALFAAELRAGAAEVVRPEIFHPSSLAQLSTTDHTDQSPSAVSPNLADFETD
jgi:hypothetical protein